MPQIWLLAFHVIKIRRMFLSFYSLNTYLIPAVKHVPMLILAILQPINAISALPCVKLVTYTLRIA